MKACESVFHSQNTLKLWVCIFKMLLLSLLIDEPLTFILYTQARPSCVHICDITYVLTLKGQHYIIPATPSLHQMSPACCVRLCVCVCVLNCHPCVMCITSIQRPTCRAAECKANSVWWSLLVELKLRIQERSHSDNSVLLCWGCCIHHIDVFVRVINVVLTGTTPSNMLFILK